MSGPKKPATIVAAIVIGLVLHSAMYGPQASFFAELSNTRRSRSPTSSTSTCSER